MPLPGMVTLRIYLVGDNMEMNGHLANRLERHAHIKIVATARDEAGAMQWLAQRHNDADLVIVDIFLEAGSGLGLLRRSQRTPHGRQLVVLSNFVGGGLRHTCMALGAAQVFDKSTGIDSLVAYCQGLAASTTVH
ncbi:MAG: response regulator [Rhodoferax sp.]|nr:response regulator [Rhodoferax sp.]